MQVDFGYDLEEHLNFLVDCRAAFGRTDQLLVRFPPLFSLMQMILIYVNHVDHVNCFIHFEINMSQLSTDMEVVGYRRSESSFLVVELLFSQKKSI